ncbi:L,D-transpeptidase [Paracoccus sp. TK19116]|uniref:L,D-transpeptidase n=1 Tax=Paracoccus albicereus TaxID=2922394 RepID=A0ABT1MSR9_9RHOB|nr:L,D-transpeptidase [Paracoccus albicereus]MCQ0971362.1 L,D-transpeptidase [Paracoccus albicereus]
MRIASLSLALVVGLSACAPTTPETAAPVADAPLPSYYQARQDVGPNGEPITINAVKRAYLNERNQRQRVPYNGPEEPGTIVVDPYARVLYDVMPGGEAMRFGVAVGKAGTGFAGNGVISRKQAWPSWTPTANMIRTNPALYGPVSGGLSGGLDNPLGARALYLYRNGQDTYYRIHGTVDSSSIGKATSAGCIRLFQQDIIDLFDDTEIGTQVKVRTPAESLALEGPMVETPQGYVVPAAQAQAPAAAATPAAAPAAQTAALAAPTAVMDPYAAMSPVESAVQ